MKILLIGRRTFKDEISKLFSHIHAELSLASTFSESKSQLSKRNYDIVFFDDDHFTGSSKKKLTEAFLLARSSGKPFLVISSDRDINRISELRTQGAADFIARPFNEREFIMRFSAVYGRKIRIACLGGGSGLFTLLMGLKNLPGVLLTSIVTMSDDGGSSGKLSRSLGVLPPGDVRRSLVALSNAPEIMSQIMQYRFENKGDLEGHSFGNIFLAALAGVKGSMPEAVRALSDILYIQGIVLPVCKTLTKLVAKFEDGTIIEGESRIDRCEGRRRELKIQKLFHEPEPEADVDAVASILFADFITIGPGDLFTSIIANIAIPNIREAITRARATKIYVCNLMTKPGETHGFNAIEHIQEIIRYLGQDILDYILISNTRFSKKSISDYAKKGQSQVLPISKRRIEAVTKAKVIYSDIADADELVRHDSLKLKTQIQKIISSQKYAKKKPA